MLLESFSGDVFKASGINPLGMPDSGGTEQIAASEIGAISGINAGLIGLFGCDTQGIALSFQGKDNSSKPAIIICEWRSKR